MGTCYTAYLEVQLPVQPYASDVPDGRKNEGWECISVFDLGKAYEFPPEEMPWVSEPRSIAIPDHRDTQAIDGRGAIVRACEDALVRFTDDENRFEDYARALQYRALKASALSVDSKFPIRVLVAAI